MRGVNRMDDNRLTKIAKFFLLLFFIVFLQHFTTVWISRTLRILFRRVSPVMHLKVLVSIVFNSHLVMAIKFSLLFQWHESLEVSHWMKYTTWSSKKKKKQAAFANSSRPQITRFDQQLLFRPLTAYLWFSRELAGFARILVNYSDLSWRESSLPWRIIANSRLVRYTPAYDTFLTFPSHAVSRLPPLHPTDRLFPKYPLFTSRFNFC